MESLLNDLKHSLRMFRQSPAFTTTAIAALALGIGANTAIFSVINTVLLKPLPYPDSDRIVQLMLNSPQGPGNITSIPKFMLWCEQNRVFEHMAAYDFGGPGINLSGSDRPEQVKGIHVSANYFRLFGASPAVGRTFTSDEDRPRGGHYVVISNGLWKRRYGSDPSLVGKIMLLGGEPYTVVGALGAKFAPDPRADLWLPLQADPNSTDQAHYLRAAARLKPGATLDMAKTQMKLAADQYRRKFPGAMGPDGSFTAELLQDTIVSNVRPALLILVGAVSFVLLIACANVANLLLMRGTGRLRELAVRSALGAPRSRIVRQLFVESLLLTLAGMAAGLVFAQVGLRSLLALIPQNAPLPRSEPIAIDARVLLFTFLASLFTAVVFGLVPALRLSRVDLQNALKQGTLRGGVGGHQTLRRSFVVAEVALALLLSVGAGLMLRSFARLISVDPGFSPEHLLTMHIWTSPARYHDNLKRSQYFDRVLAEIRSAPGVQAAGSTHFLPLTERISGSCFSFADQPAPSPADSPSAQFLIISSGYFQTMGTALIRGRDFDHRDRFNSLPVAIVNHAFVHRYYSVQNALGKQLRVCWDIEKPVEIVGVVADARQAQLQDAPKPTIFLSNSQAPMYFATLVVRATGDPIQIARSTEEAIHRVDPDQAVSDIQTMETVFSDSVSSPRFQAILLLVFAGLAVALAMIGVYGIVSYSISQRTNELGIRIALGARAADVVRLVLCEAFVLAAIALLLGLAGSIALSRVLQSLLFEVTPTDPVTLASVCFLVLAVTALAAVPPARRATRIDPLIALRYE